MKPLTTSLAEIRAFRPCPGGWTNILAYRNSLAITAGKPEADHEEQFPLVSCLESNSIADVLWLIGKRKAEIQIAVKFARLCADSVAHLNNNRVNADANAAAANANSAAAYAADATYATYAAATYATYAAANATYAANAAANAANYAAYATYANDDTAYDDTAYDAQMEKNRQFLIQCINEFTLPIMPAPVI